MASQNVCRIFQPGNLPLSSALKALAKKRETIYGLSGLLAIEILNARQDPLIPPADAINPRQGILADIPNSKSWNS
jgi:hypothetical protein